MVCLNNEERGIVIVNLWYSSYDSDITIEDDSSWKPVDAFITPASDRHGYIEFADTELAKKYVVKKPEDAGKVLVVLKDVSKWDVDLENDVFEKNNAKNGSTAIT